MKKKYDYPANKKPIIDRMQFLDEAVKHYSKDPKKRRSLNHHGSCLYTSIDPSCSQGCAIGRWTVPKSVNEGALSCSRFEQLPLFLRILGLEFLSDMQGLHDGPLFWDADGLTPSGITKVSNIKQRINSGHYDRQSE